MDAMEYVNARLARMEEEKKIKCPFCGESHNYRDGALELYDDIVEAERSDEPFMMNCVECDIEFYVHVTVIRSFEAKRCNC